jgi:hypothetical protein
MKFTIYSQILFSSIICSNIYFLFTERWRAGTLTTSYLRPFETTSTKHEILLMIDEYVSLYGLIFCVTIVFVSVFEF